MKVLFVSSGNSKAGISPIVKAQGESLKSNGINLDYFTIQGKGVGGYLKNIPKLKKFLKMQRYDLIHAHYSLSSIVASLSTNFPLVVSLMGSDVESNLFWKFVINFFYRIKWNATIVKSEKMRGKIGFKRVFVIPNGVDFDVFKPVIKDIAKRSAGFDDKRHIIFVANPQRREKNYQLAKKVFDLLDDKNVELNILSDIEHNLIPYYMNAADVLLLTSLWEGSPNVIKEAMACNLPIVSTDVGDVKEVIRNTKACYICSYAPEDVAEKIRMALEFGKRTNGREHILDLGLDSNIIAQKIISVYKQVLNEK